MVWSCDTGEVLVVTQMIIAKYNQRQKPLYGISQAALWLDSTNHIKITQTVKLSFDGYSNQSYACKVADVIEDGV